MLTQGLNLRGGLVAHELNGLLSFPTADLLAGLISQIDGFKYWFVRENPQKNDWFGPTDYNTAKRHAMWISQDENKSGVAEMVVFLGTRPGDPISPPKLKIHALVINGKITLGGGAARTNSGRINIASFKNQ